MSFERDAIDPYVKQGDTSLVVTDDLRPGEFIDADSQWIRLVPYVAGAPNAGFLRLVNEENQNIWVGPEPVYISGRQRLRVPPNTPFAGAWIMRAPRKEMLPGVPFPSYPSNGSGQEELYNATFTTPVIAAGEWAYLSATLDANGVPTWLTAPAASTPNGMPYGWAAPSPAFRGRYYDVHLALDVGGGGSKFVLFAPVASTTGGTSVATGFQVAATVSAPVVYFTVGDEATNLVTTVVVGTAGFANVKTAKNWTVAIQNTNPGFAVTGFMTVLRRGY